MADVHSTERFYDDLTVCDRFEDLTDTAQFSELPEDWLIGVADIVDSTSEIAQGRYRSVNMVGAAVIAALMNTFPDRRFPFVFSGDGASFAIWPSAEEDTRSVMGALRRWAEEEFGMSLRTALVPARDAVRAGRPVLVARYGASQDADYAMFAGGGVSWAEARMKAGDYMIDISATDQRPDLTGLTCRWANMQARSGVILSLVVVPQDGIETAEFRAALRALTELTRDLDRGGHPAPVDGPGTHWPTEGTRVEAQARGGEGNRLLVRIKVVLGAVLGFAFLRTGWKIGGFDPRHFVRVGVANADFRKIDDGLKMTIDCDAGTKVRIDALLERNREAGVLRYGMSEQSEAMMTCIVPAALADDHLHFIDGAEGGYALAASRLKG